MSDGQVHGEQGADGLTARRRQRTRGRKAGGTGQTRTNSGDFVFQPSGVLRRRRRNSSSSTWDSFHGGGVSNPPVERLNRDLKARLAEAAPQPEELEAIETCLAALRDHLSRLGVADDWSLELFGSAANGFAVRGSDVDVTCLSLSHLRQRRRFSSDLSDPGREQAAESEGKRKDQNTNKKERAMVEKKVGSLDESETGVEGLRVHDGAETEQSSADESQQDGAAEAESATEQDSQSSDGMSLEEEQCESVKGTADTVQVASRTSSKEDHGEVHPEYLDPQHVLRIWMSLLENHQKLKVVEHVLFAKVPIVKVEFDDIVEVDLSVQNYRALQNTKLLRAYSNMHPKVRELVIAVKLWAKGAHVCGAAQQHLSSYSFALLTIYFLQVSSEVGLPWLPPSAFEAGGEGEEDEHVKAAMKAATMNFTVAELLINFFMFYNYCFAWGREVASIRLGVRHIADEAPFEMLQGRWTSRIHIEDPYQYHRNLHCVLGCCEELQLRTAFAEAMQGLACGMLPRGLEPSFPEAVEDVVAAPTVAKTSTADATTDDAAGGSGGEVSSFSDEEGKDGFQWWKNLKSSSVQQAMGAGKKARPRTVSDLEKVLRDECTKGGEKPRFLTLQDFEERIGEPSTVPQPLLVPGFVSSCTKGIAARVNKLCADGLQPQIQLQ